jgi:hypothetical protein
MGTVLRDALTTAVEEERLSLEMLRERLEG